MNRIKTLCASFVLSCIMGVSVFAQGGYEVKGVVVDAIGPVIGATVIEQGTTNGTSTGLDGDYVLTVSSADAVIEISCIGYAPQTFVASQVPATITLAEDTQFLDEVVVIGYGTVKKEDMTGSITAIKSEELNRGAMVNTQDMLKGKVPGLHIIPGDGGPVPISEISLYRHVHHPAGLYRQPAGTPHLRYGSQCHCADRLYYADGCHCQQRYCVR